MTSQLEGLHSLCNIGDCKFYESSSLWHSVLEPIWYVVTSLFAGLCTSMRSSTMMHACCDLESGQTARPQPEVVPPECAGGEQWEEDGSGADSRDMPWLAS